MNTSWSKPGTKVIENARSLPQLLAKLEGHTGCVQRAELSPDGQRVVTVRLTIRRRSIAGLLVEVAQLLGNGVSDDRGYDSVLLRIGLGVFDSAEGELARQIAVSVTISAHRDAASYDRQQLCAM